MNIINELLSETSQDQQKAYESYLHAHLKLLMTSINKAKVQDMTQHKIRKNQCINNCYQSLMASVSADTSSNSSLILQQLEQIRQCKRLCGRQVKAVKKYLDDINYYSSLKFQSCLKGYETKNKYSKQFNDHIWNCYNRLDRRYKEYWVQERVKIQNKHQHQIGVKL